MNFASIPRRRLVVAAAALTILPLAASAQAADYPTHPVSLVVGFAPGGSADILARLIAQKLSGPLKQQVIVDNKAGAGGTIAAAQVASAKPDGQTLLLVTSGHAGAGALYRKLSFDPVKSFVPVIKLGATPVVVVVPAKSPLHSLKDVIATAKKSPGKLNYAAGGGGATVTSLAAEYLKHDAGVDMVMVNYKGSGPALMALLAGEVDLGFDIPSSSLPYIKSGRLRALAVTSRQRTPALPGVPTVAEQGIPNYEVSGWFGVLAPAGTPPAIVTRLNTELRTILAEPDVKAQLANLGMDAGGGTPGEFAKLIDADTRRAGDAIHRMGLTPQ
jgi:tripartite-type tricarboxylate transporter receptor subunit TctC